MNSFDRQQMLSALILVVIVLFVSAGAPFGVRWRRELRLAALVVFFIGLAAALIDIFFWWIGRDL